MLFLIVGAAIWAAVRLQGHALFVPAVVVAIIAFVSLGILHNYRDEPMSVDGNVQRVAGGVSMLASVAAVALLIVSFTVESECDRVAREVNELNAEFEAGDVTLEEAQRRGLPLLEAGEDAGCRIDFSEEV